ncbi:MAG TPA: DMT family transporter [Patescibacteria group bacterium]|nr:DMT family transporter [Patescibacteria group bacterium]
MRDRPILLGSIVVVLAASGFGLLGPLARFAYEAGFAPLSFVAWRALFGLAVIAVLVAVGVRRGQSLVNPLRLPRGDGLGLLVIAVAGFGLNVAMFFAFDVTTVALALLAFYTYPALVAVVAVVLGHERLDATRWLALVLAVGGMALVVAGGSGTGGSTVSIVPLGLLLGFIAGIWQTIFVTVSRGRFLTVPAEQATAWVLLFATTATATLALIVGDPLDLPLHEPRALVLAAFTGVAAAGVPSVLFLVGIRLIGGTRAGILMLFEPVVGVTLAAILLREALLPAQALGGVAILGAALLIQRSSTGEVVEPAAAPLSAGDLDFRR